MYVGVTYTGNGPYRSEVPAVSSRSLDSNSLFQVNLLIKSPLFYQIAIHYLFPDCSNSCDYWHKNVCELLGKGTLSNQLHLWF